MWHNILEYLKPVTGFLAGNLLGLARWWVSRAETLHHPARVSPLQIFRGNISAFALCGLFHHLFIHLKFCRQAIKRCVSSWTAPLHLHLQLCSPELGNFWHPALFCPAWRGPAALPHVAVCAWGGAHLHWPLLPCTTRPPTPHHLPPLLDAPIPLARSLYPYRNDPTPQTHQSFSRNNTIILNNSYIPANGCGLFGH